MIQGEGRHGVPGYDRATWEQRREADARLAGVRAGRGCLYRAGEVLLAVADEPDVLPALRQRGARADGETNERLVDLGLAVRRWRVDDATDVPALLREVRALRGPDDPAPRVALNTVLTGEGKYHGGPGGPPRTSGALPELGVRPEVGTGTDVVPHLAVLDTGWSRDMAKLHGSLLARLRAGRDDVDLLDVDGLPGLDTQAGHGTFVCGLVARVAGRLRVDVQRVLDPVGWGDDLSVAVGLMQQRASVVNLSLGGFCEDDRPPLALQAAIDALPRDTVVVAAAGNDGSTRPFWPAACKGVVAVAALDTTTGTPVGATFSNRGPWVDVCAPGVHVQSAYVTGHQDAGAGPQEFAGWACWSGTSFAAPLVAAAIAQAATDGGVSPRTAAAGVLGGLQVLPGLADFGVAYDPGVDLLCRQH